MHEEDSHANAHGLLAHLQVKPVLLLLFLFLFLGCLCRPAALHLLPLGVRRLWRLRRFATAAAAVAAFAVPGRRFGGRIASLTGLTGGGGGSAPLAALALALARWRAGAGALATPQQRMKGWACSVTGASCWQIVTLQHPPWRQATSPPAHLCAWHLHHS